MVLPAIHGLIDRLHSSGRERATAFKVMSFGLVGLINTAVDLGIFSLGYYIFGLPIIVANMFSWAVAVTCSYILNSKITFSVDLRRELSVRNYVAFVLAQVAGFAANTSTVVIASHFMPVLLGKVFAIGASFIVNFSLSHFVVFRRATPSL
ncbi:MAG TPA: GtrA family protein [Bradyrhizobium sp.]|uniref:GtrA family protein n=1 Tax=Bradyrhizobium sp. TaxID=376 RepID=UPI002C48EE49|nr:GtrA family protein [Bradyrhizobium sp.]HLZ03229.1 GtrA family protein [Bradyrhizobium sp.]